MDQHSGFVVCGLWFVVCGLWFVVCGLWFVVCGLWFVACDAAVQAAAIVRDDGAQARLQPHCAAGVTCDV